MNKVIFIGNLTADPKSAVTQSGKEVVSFSVAVNKRGQNGEKESEFINVSTWGKTAENCRRFLAKGRKVMVSGEVSARAYQGKDGNPHAQLEIRFCNEVEFLSSASESKAEEKPEIPAPAYIPVETDQLPF